MSYVFARIMDVVKRKKKKPAEESQDQSAEWSRRLGRVASIVATWRERAENPLPVEDGSSLAVDAVDGLTVESSVWYSMCVSSEHLGFALDTMQATGTMYPTAYMTVTRTAFVAAVNAVWLLAGTSRQERRERALKLRADEIRVQIVALRDMAVPDGRPDAARDELIEQLRERQTKLQKAATLIGVTEDVTKMRFNQTKAIDWVAEHMHGVADPLLIGATQSIWRSGSAAAHAQMQFGIMRMGQNEVVSDVAGGQIMRLRGNLETDVGPAIVGATLTLNEAFRLYDLRRAKQT